MRCQSRGVNYYKKILLSVFFNGNGDHRYHNLMPPSFPTRRSSDLVRAARQRRGCALARGRVHGRVRRLQPRVVLPGARPPRSEEHTSELQSLMRNSYAVFCLKKKKLREEDSV